MAKKTLEELYSDEHLAAMTENRKPPRETYAEKYSILGKVPLRHLSSFISREMSEMIGQWDLENQNNLIPYVNVDHDPFKAFEETWDIRSMEDYNAMRKSDRWTKVSQFQPVRCHMFKHQDPLFGALSINGAPTRRFPYVITHREMNRSMNYMLQYSSYDQDKLWRIEGMAIPTGMREITDCFEDESRVTFNKDFGFGDNLYRSFYAYWDTKEEKFVYVKRRKYKAELRKAGANLGYYDKPVFAPNWIFKYTRQIVAVGYDVEEFYKNVRLVRYVFYPLKSFKYHPKYNTMDEAQATKMYREGDEWIVDYNYHAFRYHHKKLAELRRKI